MIDGLQITIRAFGPRWIIECGADRVEVYDIQRGLNIWIDKYGEKYGVEKPEQFTVVLPWADSK